MNNTFTDAPVKEGVRAWLLLVLLSLIWGSSYILIKKSLVVYSPVQVACLRLSISALAFLPFFIQRFRTVPRRQYRLLLAVGLTGTALPSFLFALAQTQVSSSVAGILNSLSPLFTMLLGIFFFRAEARLAKIMGVILGLAGAVSLLLFGQRMEGGGNMALGLLIVLATICYATSSNLVGFYLRQMSSLTISAFSFFVVGAPAIVLLFGVTDFVAVLQQSEGGWQALGYVAILALFSTVLASVLFFKLIQWTNPVFGSTVSYLVPVVALLWGVWDGERITELHVAGMLLILLGVYLSRK